MTSGMPTLAAGLTALRILLGNARTVWCLPAAMGFGVWVAWCMTGGLFCATPWLLGAIVGPLAWFLVGLAAGGNETEMAILLRRMALCVAPLSANLISGVFPDFVALRGPVGILQALTLGVSASIVVVQWSGRWPRRPMEAVRAILATPATIQIAAALWGGMYVAVTVACWWRMEHNSPDLAIFEQSLYNTLHGRFLQYSCDGKFPDMLVCRFADHFDPILLLLLPLYAVWNSPVWLLTTQALVLASGAIPVRGLALRLGAGPVAATLLGLAYLLHPAIASAVLAEFHPGVMGGPFVLWGLHLLLSGRLVGGWVMMILALSCKESLPGTVCMAGLYVAWRGLRRPGLELAAFSVVWGVMALRIIIPHFSPTGQSAYWAMLYPHGITGQLPAGEAAAGSLIQRITYWCDLLGPVGTVSLLAPAGLIVSLPEGVLNWTSHILWMRNIVYHYHVVILVGVMLGAAEGLGRCRRWLKPRLGDATGRAVAVAFAVAAGAYLLRGGLYQEVSNVRVVLRPQPAEVSTVHRLLAQIPAGAPVLVNTGGLATQLARRERLLVRVQRGRVNPEVMHGVETVDYVALDVRISARERADLEARYGLQLLGRAGDVYLWRTKRQRAP
jgi:uncharacterized membrane protein